MKSIKKMIGNQKYEIAALSKDRAAIFLKGEKIFMGIKGEFIGFKLDPETDEQLKKIAVQQHKSKSSIIRDFIDKGLKTDGYKNDDDRLYQMILDAVHEVLDPQVKRFAAILAKDTHISASSFFMQVLFAKSCFDEDSEEAIEEAVHTARRLGIEYLKLKDSDLERFFQNNVSRMG